MGKPASLGAKVEILLLLVFVTLAVESALIVVIFTVALGYGQSTHYVLILAVGAVVQVIVMGLAVLLFASIRTNRALSNRVSMIEGRSDRGEAATTSLRSQQAAELGQLAAGIVHDVRSPLSAIRGSLDLLPTASDPEELLQVARDELVRIDVLLGDLLALGKSARGEQTTRELREKVQDVVRLLAQEAASKEVNLSTVVPDMSVAVACDPNRIKQALTNVVKNAIEATGRGGAVKVTVDTSGANQVRIRVQDTGHGMAAPMLRQIGEPFFTTKASGNGLGLMMAKNIIESQRGHIDVCSTPGIGTTVTIFLPSPPALA